MHHRILHNSLSKPATIHAPTRGKRDTYISHTAKHSSKGPAPWQFPYVQLFSVHGTIPNVNLLHLILFERVDTNKFEFKNYVVIKR